MVSDTINISQISGSDNFSFEEKLGIGIFYHKVGNFKILDRYLDFRN